jgi:O-antigen/teichoic acid export membrane protein
MFSLKKLAISGTLWTFFGYGAAQALRLIGNLILTRLLVPEMFGLMALVNVFIIGLNLFSDLGIGPSIIQNSQGDEPDFYNTAWTIQIIRGFGLLILCLILAYPLANFYQEPQLLLLLPIIGFSMVIAGFNSTSLFTLNRQINLAKLTIFEFIVQFLGLVIMIVWAIISPTIWALVIGNLIQGLIKMIASHFLVSNVRNRLVWDQTALEDLVKFGRWIFIATAMSFLGSQADRLILGKIFTLEVLGVYTVAYTFADLPRQLMNRINGKVMFPLMVKQIHAPRNELRRKLLKQRWLLLLSLALGLTIPICFGDWIILFLYDDNYSAGAWMLPILSMGLWLPILAQTIDPVLYALGKPQFIALGNFGKFIYMLIFIPLSYQVFGILGAVIAVAANDFPFYLAVSYGVGQEKLGSLKQDLLATLLIIALVSIVLLLRWSFGFGFPLANFQN